MTTLIALVVALNVVTCLMVVRWAYVVWKIDAARIKREYPEVCLPAVGWHHWTPWRPEGALFKEQSRICKACGKTQTRSIS